MARRARTRTRTGENGGRTTACSRPVCGRVTGAHWRASHSSAASAGRAGVRAPGRRRRCGPNITRGEPNRRTANGQSATCVSLSYYRSTTVVPLSYHCAASARSDKAGFAGEWCPVLGRQYKVGGQKGGSVRGQAVSWQATRSHLKATSMRPQGLLIANR
jgi:hypothetical protein